MGLESIRIENFRTCRSVELSNLGHLTVLVGRNGVGKSNILQGIDWVASRVSGINSLVPSFVSKRDVSADVEFVLGDFRYRYSMTKFFDEELLDVFDVGGEAKKLAKKLFCRKGESVYSENGEVIAKINLLAPCIPSLVMLKPLSVTEQHILPALKLFRDIKYYSLSESIYVDNNSESAIVSHYIPRDDYLRWLTLKDTGNIGGLRLSMEKILMCLLDLYLERKEDFEEIRSILGPLGLGILSDIEVYEQKSPMRPFALPHDPASQQYSTNYQISFFPGQGWESVGNVPGLDYKYLSEGTRRIIGLLVSIFYDKNSVYLFEQPEDGIHPGLLYKLIGLLRAYDDRGQIIMTSHSSALLDYMKPEEIRLVTMVAGETQVRAFTDLELEGAKRFLEEEGPLSEYLDLLPED